MAGNAIVGVQAPKTADERIARCLEDGKSFILDAGAGSGKTYSLVQALKLLCEGPKAAQLRRDGQQIACITFTNVAKDQITERIRGNPLVRVSTIHDFLWDTLAPHQEALRQSLLAFNDGLPASSRRKVDPAALLAKVKTRIVVKYSDRGSKFLDGRIHHDDLLSVAQAAYTRYAKLVHIVASRYPYIFVDEYQDTSRAVIEILLGRMLPLWRGKLVLGFFGDKLQNIYHTGEHKGIGELPAALAKGLEVIVKSDNRRCSLSVIDVLNGIRKDIIQVPADNNVQGDVAYIRVVAGDKDFGMQRAQGLLVNTLKWNLVVPPARELYLTHRLIAGKAGFADLLRIFTDRGTFAKEALADGTDRRVAFFLDKVEPLARAWEKGDIGATLERLHGFGFRLASRAAKAEVRGTLDALVTRRTTGTVGQVLETIRDRHLFPLADDFAERLANSNAVITSDMDAEAQEREQKEAILYSALFALPYNQIKAFYSFFMASTPYATKHGVKGDQFETVLVILDDAGASWNLYSFEKYLSGEDETKNPERASRSRNVFYVCCSRAQRNLAVIDFGGSSVAKKARMETLFGKQRCFEV